MLPFFKMISNNLKVKKLTIIQKEKRLVDVAFEINSSLAIIGESGSGKSLTLKGLLNMLPSNLYLEADYESDFEMTFPNISYVPQNPFTSLSPMTQIKKQFFSSQLEQENLLSLVGLEKETTHKFPVQLSGGQLQRVVIALALQKNPKLLLLDEPTTALDKGTKHTILELLKEIQKKLDFKMLFVTHDINAIEAICEDTLILKDGKVCEFGKTEKILSNPQEAYTKNLIESNFLRREYRR